MNALQIPTASTRRSPCIIPFDVADYKPTLSTWVPSVQRRVSANATDAVFDDDTLNHERLAHFSHSRTGFPHEFLRDAFNLRHISIHLTDTDSEVADIFTKAKMKVVANYKAFRAYLFNMH